MKKYDVICPGCGRKLSDTAMCMYCENKRGWEEEKAYQRLFKDICRIIEAAGLGKKKQIYRRSVTKKKFKSKPR